MVLMFFCFIAVPSDISDVIGPTIYIKNYLHF